MRPFVRALALLAALPTAACLRDAPLQPTTRVALALRVSAQLVPAGSTVGITIEAVARGQDRAPIPLFHGSFSAGTGAQQIPVTVDLTPCLSLSPPDSVGPYCSLMVDASLIGSAGDTLTRSFSSSLLIARPGQVAQSQPIYLVVGNHPPVLTGAGNALVVESGLIRYQAAGTDQDGDLLTIYSQTILDTSVVGIVSTTLPAPVASFSGTLYALQPPTFSIGLVAVTLFDTKYDASATDTIFSDFTSSASGLVDTLGTSATSDSLVVTFHDLAAASDSAEVVVRNAEQSNPAADSIYFVCGGRYSATAAPIRVACALPAGVPTASATVIVVPIDAKGQPGFGLRCGVPGACTQPPSAGYRRSAARRR